MNTTIIRPYWSCLCLFYRLTLRCVSWRREQWLHKRSAGRWEYLHNFHKAEKDNQLPENVGASFIPKAVGPNDDIQAPLASQPQHHCPSGSQALKLNIISRHAGKEIPTRFSPSESQNVPQSHLTPWWVSPLSLTNRAGRRRYRRSTRFYKQCFFSLSPWEVIHALYCAVQQIHSNCTAIIPKQWSVIEAPLSLFLTCILW